MTHALELSESEQKNPSKAVEKYAGLAHWAETLGHNSWEYRQKLSMARNLVKEQLYAEAFSE